MDFDNKDMKRFFGTLLSFIFSFFFFLSCQNLDVTNPADPDYTIKPPTNLNVTALDDQSVRLTWTDNCSFESGFRIERKEESGSYIQIAEIGANVTSFDDAGLTYGKVYYYQVRAYTSQNNSTYSNEKSVVTVIPAPSNLNVTTIDDQSVRLTWMDNCTFESGFKIERKEEGGNYLQITEVGANVTSFDDAGLTYGKVYYYQVRAYTSQNNSVYSNEKTIQMITPAPSNLDATAINDQSVRLTWTDNCSFESGFRIERKEEGGSYAQIAVVGANMTTYDDAGLTYDKLYYYRVRAYTSQNNSTYSNEKSVVTVFPAPSNLNVTTIDDQSVRLTWMDNCTFESGFKIERKEESGSYVQINDVDANATTYDDDSLTVGKVYFYRVKAYSSSNSSDYSNEKSITTVFPAPSNLNVTALGNPDVRLTWTDNCSFESGFRIERKEESGSYVQIAEVGANVTSFDDAGLAFGKTYYYRVRAFTAQNRSAYSNEKIFYSMQDLWNGTWKVTSTNNTSSGSNLIVDETLTFSNSIFNGSAVTGNVKWVSISWGIVNGTYEYDPTGQTLVITYTGGYGTKTYTGVSINQTQLNMSSGSLSFSLAKQ